MTFIFKPKVILLSFLLLFMLPQQGYSAPQNGWQKLNVARRYNLYWGGMTAGYMMAEIREIKPDIYHFELRIHSKGLLDLFIKYRSETTADFRYTKDGQVLPIYFHSHGTLRGSDRTTTITYDNNGNVASSITDPPIRIWKRDIVPLKRLVDTPDPLTAAVISREIIKRYIDTPERQGANFHIPIYDGRRLGDYIFNLSNNQPLHFHHRTVPVIEMTFTRKPILGFSGNELKKLKDEPNIHVFMEKDTMLLPLKAEARVLYGTATIIYDRDCISINECPH